MDHSIVNCYRCSVLRSLLRTPTRSLRCPVQRGDDTVEAKLQHCHTPYLINRLPPIRSMSASPSAWRTPSTLRRQRQLPRRDAVLEPSRRRMRSSSRRGTSGSVLRRVATRRGVRGGCCRGKCSDQGAGLARPTVMHGVMVARGDARRSCPISPWCTHFYMKTHVDDSYTVCTLNTA